MLCTRSPWPAMAAVSAALATFGACAQSFSDVMVRDPNGTRLSVSAADGLPAVFDPLTVDLALNGGLQQSLHQGTASSAQQTLRAVAALSTYHAGQGTLFDASTDASFFKRVQVLPGTSGLNWGDPVDFQVVLRFDGNFGAGLLNPLVFPNALTYIDIARVLASVETRLDYSITDLNQTVPGCGECGPPEVMGFGYYGKSTFDAMFYAWALAEGHIESRWSPSGDWIGTTLPSQNNVDFVDNDIRVGDALIHFPDTSLRSYTVSTFVGHTLQIEADLNILVQSLARGTTSQAAGYYAQTFDAGLVSSNGLEFAGETAGAFAVAEPGTWATLLAGLAFLGGVTRRRWHV